MMTIKELADSLAGDEITFSPDEMTEVYKKELGELTSKEVCALVVMLVGQLREVDYHRYMATLATLHTRMRQEIAKALDL